MLASRPARAGHALIALCVLVGLVVQLWVAVEVSATPPGHAVGTLAGTHLAGRLVRVLSFFTVQSNLLIGLVSATLAVRPDRDGRVWRAFRLAGLFGITVTGVVYATVLARIHEPHGWRETLANDLFHYVVPIGAVVLWLLAGPRPRITRATVGLSLLFPVLWLGYTLVRGAATAWYPYPFLDVTTHGYAQVAVNAVLVTLLFGAVAAVFALGDRRLAAAPR